MLPASFRHGQIIETRDAESESFRSMDHVITGKVKKVDDILNGCPINERLGVFETGCLS